MITPKVAVCCGCLIIVSGGVLVLIPFIMVVALPPFPVSPVVGLLVPAGLLVVGVCSF